MWLSAQKAVGNFNLLCVQVTRMRKVSSCSEGKDPVVIDWWCHLMSHNWIIIHSRQLINCLYQTLRGEASPTQTKPPHTNLRPLHGCTTTLQRRPWLIAWLWCILPGAPPHTQAWLWCTHNIILTWCGYLHRKQSVILICCVCRWRGCGKWAAVLRGRTLSLSIDDVIWCHTTE